jgi:hypothetical protein
MKTGHCYKASAKVSFVVSLNPYDKAFNFEPPEWAGTLTDLFTIKLKQMKNLMSRMFRITLFIVPIILITARSWSQPPVEVSGFVSDALTNKPIAGVSVLIKGSQSGVVTDQQGAFHIAASKGDVLVFSFVGYKTEEIRLGDQKVLNITLEGSASKLNEVVVIGYGTQKRSDVTGSISSVPKNRLSELPVTNVMNALEGSTAGLNIAQSASAPGNTPKVLIRGANSINASTSPLIVVDGVAFSNFGGSINDINPNDIESIEILKDASAVAIYGTRG